MKRLETLFIWLTVTKSREAKLGNLMTSRLLTKWTKVVTTGASKTEGTVVRDLRESALIMILRGMEPQDLSSLWEALRLINHSSLGMLVHLWKVRLITENWVVSHQLMANQSRLGRLIWGIRLQPQTWDRNQSNEMSLSQLNTYYLIIPSQPLLFRPKYPLNNQWN